MIAWFCDTDPQDLFGSDEQMVYGNVKGQKKKKKSFLCWSSASCFWFCVSCLPVKMSVLHIGFVSFRFRALKIFKCLFCILVLTSHRSSPFTVSYCACSHNAAAERLIHFFFFFFLNWWESKIGCATQTSTNTTLQNRWRLCDMKSGERLQITGWFGFTSQLWGTSSASRCCFYLKVLTLKHRDTV